MTEAPLPVVQHPNDTTAMVGSVRDVQAQVQAIHALMKSVMRKDVHFGVIPGTGTKPTLLKPGAEKIGLLLRLAPSFNREKLWDGPHLTIFSECTLTSIITGTIIATAGAMCTSKETKYAYRQVTRGCPDCGKDAIIKGKKDFGGGWVCWKTQGGCGAKFRDDDKRMTEQSGERKENPNLPDTYNTVLKMADKRAYVAATLFGTAASDIFTQDVEDFGQGAASKAPPPPDPPPPQPDPPEVKRDAKGNLIAPQIPEGMTLAKKLHDGYFNAASEEIAPLDYYEGAGAAITAQIKGKAETAMAREIYFYWLASFKEDEAKRKEEEEASEPEPF